MADIGTIEIKGGESASISIETSSTVSAVVSPQASHSVVVSPSKGVSVDVKTSGPSVEVASSSPGVVTTVSEKFNQIEVAAAIPVASKIRMRDLVDVEGDPESGQVLVYNQGSNNFQFQDQNAGSDGGDDLIDEAITVTNPDFETQVGSTYETGTSITSVLKNILDPYQYPKFSSFSLSFSDSGSNPINVSAGGSFDLEVGDTASSGNFNFSVDSPSDVNDSSVALLRDGAVAMSGLDPSNSSQITLSGISHSHNTPTSISYKMRMKEIGNPTGVQTFVHSKEATINFYYRIAVAASSTIPSNNDQTDVIYAGIQDSRLIADPGSGQVDLVCRAANEGVNNYTYLLIPEAFGTLKSVLQNSSTDVTADFVQVGDDTFTVSISTGISVAYYLYRTNDPGAFNNGITLNVKLN